MNPPPESNPSRKKAFDWENYPLHVLSRLSVLIVPIQLVFRRSIHGFRF